MDEKIGIVLLKYFLLAILAITAIALLGLVGPALLSAKSDYMAMTGVGMYVISIPGVLFAVFKIITFKFKQKQEENEED